MISFLEQFDGTGRQPRAIQTQFLEWLSTGYHDAEVHGGQLTVGSGKSAVSRAIQLVTRAPIINPSNVLIDQNVITYPYANFLKGKAHYACFSGLSCSDWIDSLEQEPCLECPYKKARECAHANVPTFFNPLSYYYFSIQRRNQGRTRPKMMVVDEAHQLASMVLLLCEKRFRHSIYKFDERCTSEVYLAKWMGDQLRKLQKLANVYTDLLQQGRLDEKGKKKLAEMSDEIQTIGITLDCLNDDPQNYAIYIEDGMYRNQRESFLHVRPIRPPRKIVRRLLDCDKLVLLSGTLLETDMEDLSAGRSNRFIDLPSPIPKDVRPIFYKPCPFPVNKDTDPRALVEQIEKVIDANPGVNTIIHTTYDRSKKLAPHFTRKIHVNTPQDKNETLERFKRDGGIWLAAGCAEGLDLKDDLCRLNIIPHLITPNLGDPVVKKRKALDDGDKWLALETLKVAIQQAGRSTRHEKDFSKTYILDPRLPSLNKRFGKFCPQSFTEAIRWSL